MDRPAVHRRLTGAGLDEGRATALTTLLWNVHVSGEVREVDIARLSDAGFRHVDVCVMCELLLAALSRRGDAPVAEAPVAALLGALEHHGRPDAADE